MICWVQLHKSVSVVTYFLKPYRPLGESEAERGCKFQVNPLSLAAPRA